MYQVLESRRPAEYPEIDCWNNSKFATKREAIRYAKQWMGRLAPRTWPKDDLYVVPGMLEIKIIKVKK